MPVLTLPSHHWKSSAAELSPAVSSGQFVHLQGELSCITWYPVTAVMDQHVLLVLHICHATDVKRLQGCELGFTLMNKPASASLCMNLSCANERCFCLSPSETKLYILFLYLFSCLNRHWEGRGVYVFFLSPKRIESLFFWRRKAAKNSLQSSCKWLHSSFLATCSHLAFGFFSAG